MAKAKSVTVYHVLSVNERGCNPDIQTFRTMKEAEAAWVQIVPEWEEDGIEFGNYWNEEGDIVCIMESQLK